MAKLIYASIMSLDGFVEDESGRFDWSAPDEEAHRYLNDQEREVGTHLYGRRMYETMLVWETDPSLGSHSPIMADYARIWQSADKIVYSSTLQSPSTTKTRIERRFDPEAVRRIVASADRELTIGGSELAAQALKAGLVDELRLYVVPVIIGGGKPSLPRGKFIELELLSEHRFSGGWIHLRYQVVRDKTVR